MSKPLSFETLSLSVYVGQEPAEKPRPEPDRAGVDRPDPERVEAAAQDARPGGGCRQGLLEDTHAREVLRVHRQTCRSKKQTRR